MKRQRFRAFWPTLAVLGVLIIGFGLGRVGSNEKQPTPAPVILQQVRMLGDLHLVEHQYQTVMTMESHKEPAEWTQSVPVFSRLASNVVEAATKNTALVTVNGSVEAGVDLSKAEITQSGETVTVLLPKARIYPANVDATLHSQKRSIGWDDRNLSLKARREGAQRFESSSVKSGILVKAEERAEEQVTQLFKSAGVESVKVEFK